jgi:predicted  nucleic acid-binding Zn-ribbon protein
MADSSKIEISTELLRTLHRIHRQRAELTAQLERGPRQIKAGEALVAKAVAEVETAKADLQKATLIADEKQLQLKSREMRIEDLKTKLNSAASNREFTTLKEQIAADQQANSVLSDEILEALEEIDTLEASLKVADQERQKQEAEHQSRVAEIEKGLVVVRTELETVEAELQNSESQIPTAARTDYRRMVDSRGEEALAPIDSDSCGSCYQTLTTNLVDQLRLSLLVRCPNCNAFLYVPEDLTVR